MRPRGFEHRQIDHEPILRGHIGGAEIDALDGSHALAVEPHFAAADHTPSGIRCDIQREFLPVQGSHAAEHENAKAHGDDDHAG